MLVAAAMSVSVFVAFRRLLPDLSVEALEASERALMGNVMHHVTEKWTEFSTGSRARCIHSRFVAVPPLNPALRWLCGMYLLQEMGLV